MPDSFDFSQLPRLVPRKDSWTKVAARVSGQKKQRKLIPFPTLSTLAASAASLFLMSGAFLLELHSTGQIQNPKESSLEYDALSWYSELGSESKTNDFADFLNVYFNE